MIWLMQNRETIARSIAENAPAWSVLAAYLGEKKVFDGDGKPPTARNVREAWARVQSSTQEAGPKPTNDLSAIRHIDPPVEAADDAETRFQPASLRNHTPAVTPQQAPAARPATVKRDADSEIARLLGNRPLRGFPPSEIEE